MRELFIFLAAPTPHGDSWLVVSDNAVIAGFVCVTSCSRAYRRRIARVGSEANISSGMDLVRLSAARPQPSGNTPHDPSVRTSEQVSAREIPHKQDPLPRAAADYHG
jgi:hypothetical protein